MIVNSNMEQVHMDPPPPPLPPPPTPTVSTTTNSLCTENFYLKRKHDDLNDHLDNCNYVQPKKRHIQIQNHQNQPQQEQQFTVGDENYQNLANSQSQNNTQTCSDLQYNINNNNFINCHAIEFLTYDNNLQPVPTATTTTVYNTSSSSNTTNNNNEHFDSSQWQSTDLLELDQRYNSISHCFDKIQHTNDIQQNDEILYQQQQQEQEQQLHHIDNSNQQIQQHQQQQQQQQQHNLITSNSIHLHLDNQINLNNHHHESLEQKLTPKYSEVEADFEDRNLSWLFNFRLDELPHLSPDFQNNPKGALLTTLNNGTINMTLQNKPINNNNNNSHNNNNINNDNNNNNNNNNNRIVQSKTGKKVDELIKELTAEITEDGDMIVGENIIVENSPSPPKGPKKPPFTYTELIEYALEERGELTVSGIYQWISDRFPYYKSNDDRWKNSVRHNLSINPHFRKGLKAPQGAGHLWTISSRDSEENALAWEHKKQRLELFFKMEQLHNQRQHNSSSSQQEQNENNNHGYTTGLDETTVAVQQITQQMQSDCTSPSSELHLSESSSLTDQISSTTGLAMDSIGHGNRKDLKRSAGEILNGIRRNVEVQPINCRQISTYHDSILESDYLNPINKDDDIENEGGFRNEFYITEIDPIELGINLTNVEEEVLFSDEFNLNYLGITSGNDIVA